jgi:hypothetical protein
MVDSGKLARSGTTMWLALGVPLGQMSWLKHGWRKSMGGDESGCSIRRLASVKNVLFSGKRICANARR